MDYVLNILYSVNVSKRFLEDLRNHLYTINVQITDKPTDVVLCLLDPLLLNNLPNLKEKILLPMLVGACDISNTIFKGKSMLNRGKICKTEEDIYKACQGIKEFFNNLKSTNKSMNNLTPTRPNIPIIVSGTKQYQTFRTNRQNTVAIFVQKEEFGVDVKAYLESTGKLPVDGTRIALAVYHGGMGIIEQSDHTFKIKPEANDYPSQHGNVLIDTVNDEMTPLTSFITQDGKNPKLMFTTDEQLSVSGQLGGGVDNNSVIVVRVYRENKVVITKTDATAKGRVRERSLGGYVGGGDNSGINYEKAPPLENPTLIAELTIVLFNGTGMTDNERFVQKNADVSPFFGVFDGINRVK